MAKPCELPVSSRPPKKLLSKKKKGKGNSPEFGLSLEEARQEAQRCLGMLECESCDLCSLFCPELCITRDDHGRLQIDLDYCKGCGICAVVCPKGAIQMVLEQEG